MKDTEKTVHTRAHDYHVVVDHYGNGKGTREQFQNSDPSSLGPVLDRLGDLGGVPGQGPGFAQDISDRLGSIANDLAAAWSGKQADDAIAIIKVLQGDAATIAQSTQQVYAPLADFQRHWNHFRDQAGGLDDDDDDQAHTIFKNFTAAQDTCMWAFPNSLTYHNPLGDHSGAGGGGIPNTGIPTIPTLPPPGFGTGSIPPITGLGGSGGGLGDLGSSLAGLGGGGAGGAGDLAGLGAGGGLGDGGLGAGAGVGAGGLGAGGIGGGAGGLGAGGAGRGGFLPPPMGGGAGGGQEQDRERSTWLNEDDDIWGDTDAPSSTIT